MNHVTEQLKHGVGQAIESLSEGWRDLKARAGGALTRFRAPERPVDQRGGDDDTDLAWPGLGGWAFMAADVFDDDDRVVVRLEAPGMRREDFTLELQGTMLSVRGEKRRDHKVRRGGYQIVQCAYGAFHRDLQLPCSVQAEKARATYRDGVLRIELPKTEGARRARVAVKVH